VGARVYFSVQLITICAVVNLKCAPKKTTCAVVICAVVIYLQIVDLFSVVSHSTIFRQVQLYPRPAVLSWLMQRTRRTKDPKKGKAQRHFRNVFPEAHGSDNRLSSSDDDEQKDQWHWRCQTVCQR